MQPRDCETRVPAPLPHSRLLQPLDAGPEDGPGGARGAGEAEAASGGGADGRPWRAVDPGRVPLVHLPVRGCPARGGEGARLGPGPATGPCADPPLPPQTVLRVWDCLFSEGSKILFRVALTLLKHHQASILEATSVPDLCEKFKEITRGRFVTECHSFMQVGVGHARGPPGTQGGAPGHQRAHPAPPRTVSRGAVPPGTPPRPPPEPVRLLLGFFRAWEVTPSWTSLMAPSMPGPASSGLPCCLLSRPGGVTPVCPPRCVPGLVQAM